jgi:chromosome segregation ATPase
MILIDSPGFDDTTLTDINILKTIGLHLQEGSKENKFLTGIIHMRRITDNRMPRSALTNLRVLKKLCGADHYAHIALVTGHWDMVAPANGEARENELRMGDEYWLDMIRGGATVNRYENSTESALRILSQFLKQSPFELQFQKEFIAMHGNVGDTTAGKEIIQVLWEKQVEYEEKISELIEHNRRAKIEKDRMETEIQTLQADIERLRQEREREREREMERKREINENLKGKEKLINEANAARENVEGTIQKLKAEIEDLRSKQKLIDEARIAKEKAESDVQEGKQTEKAIEEDLKSKEELVAEAKVAQGRADGEMRVPMEEIEKLNQEMEKQKKINEELKSKEQLLKAGETSKKKAEKEREDTEGEVKRLKEEMMKELKKSEERENAVKADLKSRSRRVDEIEKEKEERDCEMEELTKMVERLETDKATATEAMTSLKQPARADVTGELRRWARLPFCAAQ